MEFNSQICTTKEQSERLLALGLKKETADMCYQVKFFDPFPQHLVDCVPSLLTHPPINNERFIPAWSLHRLMEIGNFVHIAFLDVNKAYKICIDNIEEKIRFGFINKEYLVEKQ